jgi:hypothetical protein
LDFDTSLFHTKSRGLRRLFFSSPDFEAAGRDANLIVTTITMAPMSGIRLAAHWRERERASPRLLVRALEDPQSIGALPDQQIGDRSLPAVSIKTRAGAASSCSAAASHDCVSRVDR